MESGIYIIKNKINNKVYVGSTKNFHIRRLRHWNELRKGKHSSIKLQRAFNKYGEQNFIFTIIEKVRYKNPTIVNKENHYIQKYNSKNKGYNIADATFGDILTNHPNRKDIVRRIKKTINNQIAKMSPLQRRRRFGKLGERNGRWEGGRSKFFCACGEKMARGAKGCVKCRDRNGTNNPFYGRHHTKKVRNLIRKNRLGNTPVNVKPIIVNGIEYKSSNHASRKLKIPSVTIRWRVISKNPRFKNYKYKV